LQKPITECHLRMGSHSVTCHPTQVKAPLPNAGQASWYSIYQPQRDARLSWPVVGSPVTSFIANCPHSVPVKEW